MMRWTKVFVLSGLLSIARTNDIIFYREPDCGSKNYVGCFKEAAEVCCGGALTGIQAVSISKDSPYHIATMFNGGGCTNEVCVCVTST